MSIKMKLSGFEELLKEIEKAGGKINPACKTAATQGADVMQNEIQKQMQNANVDGGLINRMPPPQIETEGNVITATVGYKKGAYNPHNLSDGYKAVFINYGTPRRKKHGQVKARGFIQKAKRRSSAKIKKVQKQAFEEILKGLK